MKLKTIEYEVESDKGIIFQKSLPKKINAISANRRLKKASKKVDEDF